jgi:DNA-directed RNA polymerase subunit RPC12/RpoP
MTVAMTTCGADKSVTGLRTVRHDWSVERRTIAGWKGEALCPDEHEVSVIYTLPDYGDGSSLYQCAQCGDLVVIDPNAERYVGPDWDQKREVTTCPSCGEKLGHAWLYPDHFRCPECGSIGSFEPPPFHPSDEQRTSISAWDPYAGAD